MTDETKRQTPPDTACDGPGFSIVPYGQSLGGTKECGKCGKYHKRIAPDARPDAKAMGEWADKAMAYIAQENPLYAKSDAAMHTAAWMADFAANTAGLGCLAAPRPPEPADADEPKCETDGMAMVFVDTDDGEDGDWVCPRCTYYALAAAQQPAPDELVSKINALDDDVMIREWKDYGSDHPATGYLDLCTAAELKAALASRSLGDKAARYEEALHEIIKVGHSVNHGSILYFPQDMMRIAREALTQHAGNE